MIPESLDRDFSNLCENKKYNVALYIRLSLEDNDLKENGKTESNSISNQRDLLYTYIKNNPELAQSRILEFCDDGSTGTNFHRPGITHLLKQARAGEIDCIIVKDFSRFGRSYLEVSDYIDQIFPFLEIRFISVNDQYDSGKMNGATSGVDVAFRNIIYSFYSEDLSQKVRSGKLTRAKKGEHTGAYAPYGYINDKKDKHRLVIDSEAAETVSRIFRMAISGMTATQIARLLNGEAVATPHKTKINQGARRKWPTASKDNFWTDASVTKILRDERYTGKIIYGKRSRESVGSAKTVKTPKDKWIVVSNRHTPIVTEEEFEKAQNSLAKFTEKNIAIDYKRPLLGKIKCGSCMLSLRRTKKTAPRYYCASRYVLPNSKCMQGYILESEIETALLCAIRSYVYMMLKREALTSVKKTDSENINLLHNQIKELDISMKKLKSLKLKYYEEQAEGKRSRESYLIKQSEINRNEERLNNEIQKLNNEINQLQLINNTPNPSADTYNEYPAIAKLTKDLVTAMVDTIYVHSSRSIEIQWRFSFKP